MHSARNRGQHPAPTAITCIPALGETQARMQGMSNPSLPSSSSSKLPLPLRRSSGRSLRSSGAWPPSLAPVPARCLRSPWYSPARTHCSTHCEAMLERRRSALTAPETGLAHLKHVPAEHPLIARLRAASASNIPQACIRKHPYRLTRSAGATTTPGKLPAWSQARISRACAPTALPRAHTPPRSTVPARALRSLQHAGSSSRQVISFTVPRRITGPQVPVPWDT